MATAYDIGRTYAIKTAGAGQALVHMPGASGGAGGAAKQHIFDAIKQKLQRLAGHGRSLATIATANHPVAVGVAAGALPGAIIGAQNDEHPVAGALYGAIGGGIGGGTAGWSTGGLLHEARNLASGGNPELARKALQYATYTAAAAPLSGALYGGIGTQIRTPAELRREQLKKKLMGMAGM